MSLVNGLKISIVIPTYKRDDLLALCLERLAPDAQGLLEDIYEVIVSDDAVSQATFKMICERFTWAQWVPGPMRGPSANRNSGAKYAKAEWLAFIDDDCLPSSGWLKAFLPHLNKAEVLEGLTNAERPKKSFLDEAPINLTGGYLWACNFAIQKKLFEKLGGFDENFPAPAMEDCDLYERIKKERTKVLFIPEAVVIHPWRNAKPSEFLDKYFLSLRYFHEKHEMEKPVSLKLFLVKSAFFNFRYFMLNAVKYKFNGVKYIWKVIIWNLKKAINLK